MSTQCNHYEMIGARFEYDEYHQAIRPEGMSAMEFEVWLDKKEEPFKDSAFNEITGHKGITIISDGKSGKYVNVGQVISKSKDWGQIGDYTTSPYPEEKIEKLIHELLGLDVEVERFTFTHYR